MEQWIFMENGRKIRNPMVNANVISYYGKLDGYNFEHQQKNLDNIQKSLLPFKIQLDYVYGGHTTVKHHTIRNHLAISNDKSVYWRKQETPSRRSSQNIIYINNDMMKTTMWLGLTPDHQKDVYELGLDDARNKWKEAI